MPQYVRCWNKLPAALRHETKIARFKSEIKLWLKDGCPDIDEPEELTDGPAGRLLDGVLRT